MVSRYVLTGAPGAGKTAIAHGLAAAGISVVVEAATDVIAAEQSRGIAKPWHEPGFVERILELQIQRQSTPADGRCQVFDRSPICTLALARYLEVPTPSTLLAAVDRLVEQQFYVPRALFVRPLGVVEPTSARQISYEDSLAFERLHERAYLDCGFEIVDVVRAPLAERVAVVESIVRA